VIGPGTPEKDGGVVSRTLTVKVFGVALLPCESVALQVTVVLPSGKVEPDAGAHVAGIVPSTMPVAFTGP
jgi:hypothetical protein